MAELIPDIGWMVDHWADVAPDRLFLTWAPFEGAGQTWTRAEFARDVNALAAGLALRGVGRGVRVALVLPNHPDFLLTWCAVTRLGGVAICLNPRSSADELAYVAGHCRPAGVVVASDLADHIAAAMCPSWLVVSGSGHDSVETLLQTDPLPSYPRIEGLAPASVQYTSGTTARPKGVVWTQANCVWAGRVGAAHQGLRSDDVNLVHLPLFHTNALSYSFLASLWSGGGLVLQSKFSASRFWDASVEHDVTWTSVVSFCLRALAGREVPADHSYRGWGNSSNVDPSPVTGGVPVVGWFGMTETVSHPIVGSLTDQDPQGTMGRPADDYGVRVLDADGHPVVPGDSGELQVHGRRGISLFAEYLDDDDATARAFTDDGWFATGDRVRLDEGGTLTFVERDKDVLKVGGENIGAPEIERALLAVPGVREAVVVGRPDRMLGEVPVAFVTARAGVTVEALHRSCAELLADYKRPREVRIVDELPRSTLDKVAKARLRELLASEVHDG